MRTKTALKIRLLNAEGKSLRQIAEAVDLSIDEVEDYLLTAGLTPTYTVKQGQRENPKRKEIRNYMENQRVLGVPMKQRGLTQEQRGLTQEQRGQIQTEFERGTRVAEIAARFSRDVSYIYKLRREWRAEQTKAQEDKNMNTESTTKTPAPAATGTSEKVENNDKVINNNDTTNCRACQVGLSMSTGGGKSAMYAKCCEEIAEIVLRLYKKMSEQDQDTFSLGEIYGRAMAAQEEEEK